MKRLPVLLALLLMLPAAGCAGRTEDKPEVVASFYPLAWVAEGVVGDLAEVVDLTPVGTEPHDLELGVRDRARIASASVVFYQKGFQPAVDEAVADAGDAQVVNATAAVALAPAAGESGSDPHVWLDPTLLAKITQGFVRAMVKSDPKNAASYRRNGRAVRGHLAELDRDFAAGLAQCRTRTVLVSHDAFGYLGRRYDLTVLPIAGISPDAEPSAKQLASLRKTAAKAKVTTVFTETLATPALAKTLARELKAKTAVLDPLEGLTKGGSGDYLSVMRDNLAALRTANGCS